MNSQTGTPTDVVLVGGGHAHVHVLDAFGRRPEPGVRLTLISRDLMTPYSGMLPGVIAGFYSAEEAQIDLSRLAPWTATRLIHGQAFGLDRAQKRILLTDGSSVSYDIVSLDVGVTPDLAAVTGAAQHGIAVKPIGEFLTKFDELRARCRQPDGPRRIAMVGGGAGGVELLLSVRTRLRADAVVDGRDPNAFSFALATAGTLLPTHNKRVQAAFRRIFHERNIELHEHSPAVALDAGAVALGDAGVLRADAVLLTTGASPPAWFADTGLTRDARGFLSIDPTLQSINDPDVFAAGDCASFFDNPREKAGVYAVRAGPPLAENLWRYARGEETLPWRPQEQHLALISTGERYAVASRGWLKAEGAWLWQVKDWIDRRWMQQYQRPPPITRAEG